MRVWLATALAMTAAVGCTVHGSRDGAAGDREVAYRCDDGQPVLVRYHPGSGRATLVRDGRSTRLQQQPAGSGLAYSDGPTTIRGKGDELTIEFGRMAPIRCSAE